MVATTSHIFSGKVDIASNLQVGSSRLFVDTENNRVGINESDPDASLHVTGNVYVSTDIHASGNVVATSFEGDGALLTGIASNLEQIVNNGNVTSNTVQFTNPDTSLVTSGNVEIGNKLSVASLTPGGIPFVGTGNALEDSYITQSVNTITITSNLEVAGNINVTGESYTIDSQSLEVRDRIIGIAYDNVLSGADTGILMEYPTKNVALVHHGANGNPYAQEFTIGYTQNTATDTTIVNDIANVITVNVLGHLHTQNNMTVDTGGSYFGDGTTLTGVALVTDLTSNAARISTLETANTVQAGLLTGLRTDVTSNTARIATLETANTVQGNLITGVATDVTSNALRITNLETSNVDIWSNLASNVTRIETLETANTVQGGLITVIEDDMTDNAMRISNLEYSNTDIWSNLASNVTRIETLETANTVQGGLITVIEDDMTDNAMRISNLETSNVDIWSNLEANVTRIATLETANTVQGGLITDIETDVTSNALRITNLDASLTDNAGRISSLEATDAAVASLVVDLRTDVNDNASRITTLYTNLADNSSRISNLTLADVTNVNNTVANIINVTGLTTTANIQVGSNISVAGLSDAVNKHIPMVGLDGYFEKSPVYFTPAGKYIISSAETEITGNLTLSGNTTLVSSTSVTIEDRIFGMGANNDVHNLDTGIMMEHKNGSTYANVALIYHGDEHRFSVGYTQNTFTDDHILHHEDANHQMLVDLRGNVLVQNNLTVANGSYFGDGTTLTGVALSSDMVSNVSRITNLEYSNTGIWSNLASNVTRIAALETANTVQGLLITAIEDDMTDNALRITNLEYSNTDIWSNLASNVTRIATLETANTVQGGLITAIEDDMTDNALRITNLEYSNTGIWSNLASNVTRIATLETANTVQGGLITAIEDDMTDNALRITNLEYSNTGIWSNLASNVTRIATLETANTVQGGLITAIEDDMTDNALRITNLEYSNTGIWSNLASNVTRIATLETANTVQGLLITAIEDDMTDNALRITNLEYSNTGIWSNLASNVTRIVTLETANTVQGGLITGLRTDVNVNDGRLDALEPRVTNLETSNVDIWSNLASNVTRIATLETANTVQGLLITAIEDDMTDNALRISNLETSNVDIWSNLASNVTRITTLETNLLGNSTRIDTLTLDDVVTIGNIASDTVQFTNVTTSLVASGNVSVAGTIVVSGNVEATNFIGDGSYLTNIASNLQAITDNGNVTSNTVLFTNATTGLVATGNVHAVKFIGSGSELTDIATTLQAVSDNGNVTSNTLLLTNAMTGIVATGNVHAYKFIGDGSALTNLPSGSGGVWSTNVDGEIYFTNSNVGISNADPGHNLSVGSNLYIDDDGSNVLVVTGNVKANYFTGDGSLLTNLPSGSGGVWSENVDGEIYFTNSNVGISNADPGHNLSVGSNLYIDDDGSNVLVITGNASMSSLTLGQVSIVASYGLDDILSTSNISSNTMQLTNVTTGLVTTGNVSVGNDLTVTGDMTAGYLYGDASNVTGITSNLHQIAENGNVTSNTLQFTNATTGFVTTANVEVGGELTVTGNVSVGKDLTVTGNVADLNIVSNVNMLHTSNTASIKLNSNVVTEFPRSKKLIKYPRVAMGSLTQDDYIVTASSTYSGFGERWKVFDNSLADGDSWASIGSTYSADGQTHTGSGTLGGFSGEWIQLQLPEKIKLEYVRIFPRNYQATQPMPQSPKDYVIIGSTDGTTYKLLATVTNQADNGSWITTNINTTELYMYFAVVVSKVHSTTLVAFSELEFYGTPEYDPEAHGVDVVVKSVPNVPNTDWLEVYYDAKNYTSGVVQDETTNNRDAEMNATFDNGTIKAFNFTGAYTSNVTTSDHGLGTGDVTYTVSYWFKRIQQRNNYDYLYMMGNGGTTGQASLMWILNDQLYLDHWGTATRYNEPIQNNRWYHVTVGHKGGQAVTNDFLYIDGQNVGVGVSTPATFNLQGAKLTLGTSHSTTNEFLEGSIANFRVFNRALTTDEIYQLYAYQKEYFGHGALGMTLKAGRLGIGTSEPRAMLDVMGGNISGYTVPYAIGGDTVNFGKYKVHIFKSSGTFTVKRAGTFEVLIVAGGGGGGHWYGGGGGAGGLINSCHIFDTDDYVVTIGGGGGGNTRGSNSTIISNDTRLIAFGGGCGGNYNTYPSDDMDGGSGGGGGSPSNAQQGDFDWRIMPGGNSTSGQGSNGGLGFHQSSVDAAGGGGGGAGKPGKRAVTGTIPGNGGTGKSFNFYSNDLVYYAGGGGGAEGTTQSGVGGTGGGGNGAAGNDSTGTLSTAGAINTGGGGGGGGASNGTGGGSGGSGIIMIRYLT